MILMKRLMLFIVPLILSFNTFAAEPNWSAYVEVLKSVSQGTKNTVSGWFYLAQDSALADCFAFV
jgi:hypothetical protein